MKKITITMALLFAVTIFVSAQNKELDKWTKKENTQSSQSVSESRRRPNVVREAGIYLEKSAKYQYAAIGLAGVGTGLAVAASFLDDKVEMIKEEPGFKMKKNSTRTACYVGAGVCAVAAICCEFVSINYKMKAGHSLRLFSTGTGGGLAYTF